MESIESVKIADDKKVIVEQVSAKVPKVHGIFHSISSIDEKHRNAIIYGIIKDYDFDIDKIADIVNNMYAWREENGINSILENQNAIETYNKVKSYSLCTIHKTDKIGRPLTIVQTGQMDLPEVHRRFTVEELMQSFHYHFELQKKIAYENLDKNGYEYLDGVTLLDMEGMTLFSHMHPPAMKLFEKVYYEYEHYFAGYISKVYLLNCPWVFKFLWNVISKMLSEVNKKKVVIINNYDDLYKYFDKDSLPVKYGGSCNSCEGGCIPVKFTDLNSKRTNKSFREELNTYHIVLKAGESKVFNLNVKKGDIVNYTISTDCYDIKFSINLKYNDEKNNNNVRECIILNESKIESDNEPIRGCLTIENDGECLAILDNSYAKWHSKTIDFEYFITNAQ